MRHHTPALPSDPGTYALGLFLDSQQSCRIGALGIHHLSQGLYVYVGSAWGPGGLAARLNRHLLGNGKLRWHIDYVRQIALPTAIWYAPHTHTECTWAQVLHHTSSASIPVPGFGASDCRCATHLYYFNNVSSSNISLPNNPIFTLV